MPLVEFSAGWAVVVGLFAPLAALGLIVAGGGAYSVDSLVVQLIDHGVGRCHRVSLNSSAA